MEEILLHTVVRNKNIREAVVIIVGKRDAQCSSLFSCEACARADVFKRPIAAIPVEKTGGGRKNAGRTICVPVAAANLVVIGVPLHVARHEQVEKAVVVVIKKARGH